MRVFTSKDSDPQEPIPFEADGKQYSFTPSKKVDLLNVLLVPGKGATKELDRTSQILNWFSKGLNKDHNEKHDNWTADCQACDIEKRINDDDDKLKKETILEIATWLIGEVSGSRPTS